MIVSELRQALATLPKSRARSVLNAYAAWTAAGSPRALSASIALARKLNRKRVAALRRTQGSLLSRVAARHERAVERLLLNAAKQAKRKVSLEALEQALVAGSPWQVLEPVIVTMEQELA
jgi:hypothetical protein